MTDEEYFDPAKWTPQRIEFAKSHGFPYPNEVSHLEYPGWPRAQDEPTLVVTEGRGMRYGVVPTGLA